MPVAEIIAIGTELLLGEIQDTNTSYLARRFRDFGIDMFRSTIIGDNPARIAQCIKEALQRAQIVITTGGLGPTIDDPTRQAVALAFGVDLVFRDELWDQIQRKYKSYNRIPTENNRRQAFIPQGATGIENPVGTAPGFYYEYEERIVISVPGVPKEMEYLSTHFILPYLKKKYSLTSIIQVKIIHTAGIGESNIDLLISDLENMENPTVGLSAHAGQCDIRVAAKAESPQDAAKMINRVVAIIQERLGNHIYGYDQDTLEEVINNLLVESHQEIAFVKTDLTKKIYDRLTKTPTDMVKIIYGNEDSLVNLQHLHSDFNLPLLLYAELIDKGDRSELKMILSRMSQSQISDTHSYGGPPQMAEKWAENYGLNFLRKNLAKNS